MKALPRLNFAQTKEVAAAYGEFARAQQVYLTAYAMACHSVGIDPADASFRVNLATGQFTRSDVRTPVRLVEPPVNDSPTPSEPS